MNRLLSKETLWGCVGGGVKQIIGFFFHLVDKVDWPHQSGDRLKPTATLSSEGI